MTDITELALITKIKKQLENFDTVVLKEGEALALVEALEKAQTEREELRLGFIANQEEAHEAIKYATELKEQLARACADSENRVRKQTRYICELFDNNIALRQRIAELESRTVKLPDCDFAVVQHMSGGSKDYCNGFVDGTQNAIRAMRAAGVDAREAE